MQLPPGLVALVRLLPRLLSAPATVYISLRVYKAVLGASAPQWLRIPAYILALPATFAARILYTRIRDRRHAARRGAVVPPSIKSSWPGAVDKLSALISNFSSGYLGKFIRIFDFPALRHGYIDSS